MQEMTKCCSPSGTSTLIPKPQLGNVEFWLVKLIARLAEQASRSGGLSKQEKGFETLSMARRGFGGVLELKN